MQLLSTMVSPEPKNDAVIRMPHEGAVLPSDGECTGDIRAKLISFCHLIRNLARVIA